LLAQIPLVGIACCCVLYLGYAGVGVLYGVFAKKNGTPISAGPVALGGAIAAAIAGFVGGVVSGIFALLAVSAGAMADVLTQLEAQGFDVPPELAGLYAGTGMGVAGAVLGVCMTLIIGAILGAIGGAIYGGTQKSAAM
jgi:hypothetical protein